MPKGRKVKENEGPIYGFSQEEWVSFSRGKRWRIKNPERMKMAVAKWATTKTPEYHRLRARKSKLKLSYGITPEDYDRMLKDQGNSCAICKTTVPTGKWKVFAVDHCHHTLAVRGLLCNECNRGIGLLRDNADLLRTAAAYLDSHTKKTKQEKEVKKNARKPKS